MSSREKTVTKDRERYRRNVADREARKLRARRRGTDSAWFGLGAFGVVGWMIALPTVLGALLGIWIDVRFSLRHSWTLMLLVIGLGIGCLNAWLWISRQRRSISDEREEHES